MLGALQSRIDLQTEFAAKVMSTMDRGIGQLVDADMNEASTRINALQTRQQLAVQSLSIANTSAEHGDAALQVIPSPAFICGTPAFSH